MIAPVYCAARFAPSLPCWRLSFRRGERRGNRPSRWGKQLGTGLFEFRVRFESETTRSLYRIFCHAFGDRVVLLLAAYDKGEDPSKRRQQNEIATARRRLKDFKRRTLDVG